MKKRNIATIIWILIFVIIVMFGSNEIRASVILVAVLALIFDIVGRLTVLYQTKIQSKTKSETWRPHLSDFMNKPAKGTTDPDQESKKNQ